MSVVTALYIFWLQDGLRIQCVLMVNAKLDPEELPQNTLQVKTDISINSVNKDKIHFVNKDKRFPFFVWNVTLFSSSF